MTGRIFQFPAPFGRVFPKEWWLVLIVLLALDLSSKKWITNTLNFPVSAHSIPDKLHHSAMIDGENQIGLIGNKGRILRVRLAFNDRFAFGIGPDLSDGLGMMFGYSVTLLAMLLLGFFRYRFPDLGSRWAWAMVFAGAFGNLIDKMFVKSIVSRQWVFSLVPVPDHVFGVVDFLEVIWLGWQDAPFTFLSWQHWPVFNLADSFVVIGMIVLILSTKEDHPGQITA